VCGSGTRFGPSGLERLTVAVESQGRPHLQVTHDGSVLFDANVPLEDVETYRKVQVECGDDAWKATGTASF